MENSPAVIRELQHCIVRDFEVLPAEVPSGSTLGEIKEKLTIIISHLLERDFNRLLNVFYRIDLDEKKVGAVLSLATPDQIAGQLAELVIERELKKAETRLKYR